MIRLTMEEFQESESVLRKMADTPHHAFVQSYRCATPRVNPDVNYGFWVVMTCQCRFTDCNKCASSGVEC